MSAMSGESGMAPETPSENSRQESVAPVFQLQISPPEGRPRLSSWLEPDRKMVPVDPGKLSIPRPGGRPKRQSEVRQLDFFEERECSWWCGCVTFGMIFVGTIGGLVYTVAKQDDLCGTGKLS